VEAPRALNTFFCCVCFFMMMFFFVFCTFSLVCEKSSHFLKPQSALSLCSRFKIDRPLVGDDDQQKCKISKRRSMTENCVIMQRVSEPISLSLSRVAAEKQSQRLVFFPRFAYFVDTKFSSASFLRALLFLSFSLSLSLSLSYGRRRDNARR